MSYGKRIVNGLIGEGFILGVCFCAVVLIVVLAYQGSWFCLAAFKGLVCIFAVVGVGECFGCNDKNRRHR